MKKHNSLHIFFIFFLAYLSCTTYSAISQDVRVFTKNRQIKASKYRITSPSSLTIFDENNKKQDITASEVDSFFIENIKYVPVSKPTSGNVQIVFAKIFIEGHYSLLETVKSNSEEVIFWDKDSTALFLNNERDFLKFREKIFLTQKLELVQLIRFMQMKDVSMNKKSLLEVTQKMNEIYYPQKAVKTAVNGVKFGFYLQGGVISSNLLYQTATTLQVAYENNSGYLGPKISSNFGAFVQLNPNKKLTFELGIWHLKYENQKVMTIPNRAVVDTLHFLLERLSIPFNIRYNFKLQGESAFFLKAGPQFNINSTLNSWIIPNYSRESRNNLVAQNTNSYGFNLGLGYSKNINHLNLALEYRYSYDILLDGVTNLGKQFTNGIYLNVGFVQR